MDRLTLQNRYSRGMGQAARITGEPYRIFRPSGYRPPLAIDFGMGVLPARFATQSAQAGMNLKLAKPYWSGIFDTSNTQNGDYLLGHAATYFISEQPFLKPANCILTNTSLSFYAQATPDTSTYSAFQIEAATTVTLNWPAYAAPTSNEHVHSEAANNPGSTEFFLSVGLPEMDAGLVAVDIAGRCYLINSYSREPFGVIIHATCYTP